jgi:hypothetical protein
MFRRFLRNLHQKPKSTRDGVALVFAGLVTSLVLFVWVYHIPARQEAIGQKYGEETVEDSSPGFSRFFSGIGEQISNLKKEESDVQSETETQEEIIVEEAVDDSFADWSKSLRSTSSVETEIPSSEYKFATDTPPVIPKEPVVKEVRIVTISKASSTATSTPNE